MNYYVNILGIKIRGESKWILLLFPVAVLVTYLVSALLLYAFVSLTGMLLFSWMNALWVMVLIMGARWAVGSSDDE